MSEKYFNAYVDAAVGTIHDYVASTLQLKAQLRIANEMIAEKDNTIAAMAAETENVRSTLTAEIETVRSNMTSEIAHLKSHVDQSNEAITQASQWEQKYQAMLTKVSHMDTLSKQYNDLKKQYLLVQSELDKAKKKLEDIEEANKSPKKVINTKSGASTKPVATTEEKTKETNTDDF